MNRPTADTANDSTRESLSRVLRELTKEFTNAMTGVLGYAQLVIDGLEQSSDRYRDAEALMESAMRASRIAEQLVAIKVGRLPVPGEAKLGSVLRESAELLRRLAGPTIDLELPGEYGVGRAVAVAAADLTQLLSILVFFAHTVLPSGGKITIRADEGGEMVPLSCEYGGGFSDAQVAALMAAESTGLDLPMARQIVDRVGGTLSVSAGDRTTTLQVHLPIAVHATTDGVEVRDGALMIVDDEPMIRRLTARALRGAGYTVAESGDAETAAEAVSGKPMLALITDLHLPGKNGIELIETLRADRPDLPAILVTGSGQLPEGAVLPRGVMIVFKPYNLSAIRNALAEVLKRQER